MKKRVLFLTGPTATGKTDLAIALAKVLPIDLISVDSALVYKGLNIGAAKPSAALLEKYPHALIDICLPTQAYSVAEFVSDCTQAIAESHAAGRVPVCVGGTILYLQALSQGLSTLPQANTAVRQAISLRAQARGWVELHKELQQVDPIAAARIHPNDPQRLQRALEVYEITGVPMTKLWEQDKEKNRPQKTWDILSVALCPAERTTLHQRINGRFEKMLEMGLIEEVIELKRQYPDLTAELPAMRAVGYRQTWEYLEGQYDKEALIAKASAATRQLAKRQLTFLRNGDLAPMWFDCNDKAYDFLQDACSPKNQ